MAYGLKTLDEAFEAEMTGRQYGEEERQNARGWFATGFRRGMERAAKIARKHADAHAANIGKGKGTWGEPGYLRDEEWGRLCGREAEAEDILRDIRAAAEREGGER